MPVAEATPSDAAKRAGGDLRDCPIFGLTLADGTTPVARGPRATRWRHVSTPELEALWSGSRPERVLDRRFPDGKLFLPVKRDDRAGYYVHAPRFGRHLVAPDGRTITSALPRIAPWRWERLFLAQVLPLAAVLQGLEVFHASAVALDGNVLAFVGAAGVGKTSTAAHLVASGLDFVTDDVLALETGHDAVVAHPGPPRLAIDADEVRRIPRPLHAALGDFLGTFEKRQFAPAPIHSPQKLSLIYFLRRAAASTEPRVTDVDEPRRLLGAPFIPHLQEPARLVRHLDVCAQIARTARTFVVDVPPAFHADAVADLALRHAKAHL